MILHLSDYSGSYCICSLAKCDTVRDVLLDRGLRVLYIEGEQAIILPEGKAAVLTQLELERLQQCCDYDVFEIGEGGNAFRYYCNDSIDNAILITSKCNSNCIMCPTAERVRREGEIYSAENLIELIRHMPSDAPHITVTGGEPFLLRRELFPVLRELRNHFTETSFLLLTNGRAFCIGEYVERYVESAPKTMVVGIPIHGPDAKLHDSITQAAGSFRETMAGLRLLQETDVRIELRVVVSKLNHMALSKIAALIISQCRHIDSVKIMGLEMTGNAAKNAAQVWIDYPNAFSDAQDSVEMLMHAGINVGIYNFPLCSVNQRYWSVCEKSISESKVRYDSCCDKCIVRDACGGVFSGSMRLAKDALWPITEI